MKNLIILLAFLSLLSCKKEKDSISNQTILKNINLNPNWIGDKNISDFNFINSINSSCKLNSSFFNRSEKQIKEDNLKCVLSKIKFDYSKLDSLKNKVSIGKLNNETELLIKNTYPKSKENADLYYQTTLYTEKNNKYSDSLIIYQSINYSEALTVKIRHYYIDKNKIYLLDVIEDESGASVEKWIEYQIENNGKIVLTTQKVFPMITKTDPIQIDKNYWKGNYHFEATNRDNAKTVYDININSLNDILININEGGIKNKYSKVKAEEVSDEKIKINFDPSLEDMGIIYIEKSDSKYLISGNPIYFINPGSDSMSLKKLK